MDKNSFFRGRQKSSTDIKSSSEGWENKLVDAIAAEGPLPNHHSRLHDDVEIFDLEFSDTEDRPSAIRLLGKDERIKNNGKAEQKMVPASRPPFHRREAKKFLQGISNNFMTTSVEEVQILSANIGKGSKPDLDVEEQQETEENEAGEAETSNFACGRNLQERVGEATTPKSKTPKEIFTVKSPLTKSPTEVDAVTNYPILQNNICESCNNNIFLYHNREEDIFPMSSGSTPELDIYEPEDFISDQSSTFSELERIADEDTSSSQSSLELLFDYQRPDNVLGSASAAFDESIQDKVSAWSQESFEVDNSQTERSCPGKMQLEVVDWLIYAQIIQKEDWKQI
ncbi:hypothetical protein NDU88_004098 [Pleurodeles waltl]|uniref:Uncharacterized protein n=1 Tax=Pleurodeles waltl TaxID=8319 RepID=A0AAV7V0F6_PLEWA|nr:hypothetical protein NDU88_004098 [Pleurodeles waltl]